MRQEFVEFEVDERLRAALIQKIKTGNEIFSFNEDPKLASLTTCLGIQSEMGQPTIDRLSVAVNVDVTSQAKNPWKSQIISYNNCIGIRLWIEDVKEFYPDHKDFGFIFHSTSLDQNNRLNQIVIFPELVAQQYAKKNLELVIVKDWALTSFLANKEEKINYFMTNEWEVENNSARLQSMMMKKNQVAFMGTHDLVDHLLGGDGNKFKWNNEFYVEVYNVYQTIFSSSKNIKKMELVASYLIGVVLDDMAQPKWYGSKGHAYVLRMALNFLSSLTYYDKDTINMGVPPAFNLIIKLLRSENTVSKANLKQAFDDFVSQVLSELKQKTTCLDGRWTSLTMR